MDGNHIRLNWGNALIIVGVAVAGGAVVALLMNLAKNSNLPGVSQAGSGYLRVAALPVELVMNSQQAA